MVTATNTGLSEAAEVKAPHGVGLAQLILGIGGLFMGTGEFAAMGLLPDFARSVHVSIPDAGHLISAYALGVVIGSPLVAIATARMDRRRLLILLGLMIFVGNIATAFAPTFGTLSIARFLAGLPHGAYYGTASIMAAAMVPQRQRAQAIGRVMLGLALANVIGVPLTTFIGQHFGWRAAFAGIGAGGALLALLIPFTVPSLAAHKDASPTRELSAFRNVQVWLTLATAAVGFAGMFAVYTYITPTLIQVSGIALGRVPLFLGLLGLGMVVGNIIGGWLTDKAQSLTIAGVQLWNLAFFCLFAVAAYSVIGVAIVLFFIGIGFAAVPALQARLMDVAPHAQSLAAAMNHSAFNLSNALGAWAGGLAIAYGWGFASTGYVAAAFAVVGLAFFLTALLTEHRGRHQTQGQRLKGV
ncbi:MAG: MFS transporter [Edaphobacter sp.]|uniref:MFS transporter n=1 Tax=Edaphobacter sp. TaxID=1934404 RepID=UPI00238FEEAD|nr:MFS transporter [Edaphobacter sp.]MDE1177547.1 MFS transporter [Edaphobacter sp.]